MANFSFPSIKNIPIDKMFVEVVSSATEEQIQQLKKDLRNALSTYLVSVSDVQDLLKPIEIAVRVMNFFFVFTTSMLF